MKIKTNLLLAVAMGGLIVCCKEDNKTTTQNLSPKDTRFIQTAAPANQAEIELGQVASSRSTTPMVKSFGQFMASEHGLAVNELMAIANSLGVTASTALDTAHASMKAKLSALSGHTLDTMYIHGQVKDHQKTLTLFKAEMDSGSNPSVKAYAAKYLPHIQMHLNKADSIWSQVHR
jgi:putative membrane protein